MTDNENQVEATAEGIGKFIVKRAKEVWDEKKGPLLLSNVDPELKRHGVRYKEVLPQGMTLRQFAATLGDDVTIVVHPIHKPKIGVVPKDSGFVFEVQASVGPTGAATERPRKPRQPSQRYVVMQFLAALSGLTEDERKAVTIPTHILAKLMEDK